MRLPTDLYITVTVDDVARYGAETCRDTPPRATRFHASARNDSTCDDAPISAFDTEAWVRHAHGTNGFGDSPIPADDTDPWMRYAYVGYGLGDDAPIPADDTGRWMRYAYAGHGFGDDPPLPADESDVWARHSHATSGFGDGGIDAPASSYEIHRAARARRLHVLGQMISESFRAVVAAARGVYARHQQRRRAKAAREALHELNDHVLRDLGFDRGEIESIAGEVTGTSECTRVRSIWSRSMRHYTIGA